MAKICDNKSVGVRIKRDGLSAHIMRLNFPRGAVAKIAGHCDGDAFELAAINEASQEGGLTVVSSDLRRVFKDRIQNPCKRDGGHYHDWEVYEVLNFEGTLRAGSDAREVFWATAEDIERYAKRTEYFMKKHRIPYQNVGALTAAIFGSDPSGSGTDPEWLAEAGMEPVWYFIDRECGEYHWPPPIFR